MEEEKLNPKEQDEADKKGERQNRKNFRNNFLIKIAVCLIVGCILYVTGAWE